MRITVKTFSFLMVVLTVLCLFGSGHLYAQLSMNATDASNSKKLQDYETKAVKGDIDAQCWLAICYDFGCYGCTVNKGRAQALYRRVVEHPNVNENLAVVQFSRGIVTQDSNKGEEWLRKAANQGFAPAQCVLGVGYAEGAIVPQNNKEAEQWIRKAADQGFAPAQFVLGAMYSAGIIVRQSDKEAEQWIRKAANQGYAEARFLMGGVYEFGRGVPQSNVEALKWYILAAVQQHPQAPEAMERLGVGKANPHSNSDQTKLLFEIAINGKRPELVKELVNKGADVNARWKGDYVFEKDPREQRSIFETLGETLVSPDESLLECAARRGHLEVVKELIKHGADARAKKERKLTALYWAAGGGHLDIVKELIKHGANVNMDNPLCDAANSGHLQVVKELIKQGADINAKNGIRYAGLSDAAMQGHLAIVKELISNGANVNAIDTDGETALMNAARYGQLEVVKELIKHGAYVNATVIGYDSFPSSPDGTHLLDIAAKGGHSAIVEELIKRGAKKQ